MPSSSFGCNVDGVTGEIKINATTAATFTATVWTFTGSMTGGSFIPSSSTVPTNGMYLPAANTPSIASNSVVMLKVQTTGVILGKGANSYAQIGDAATSHGCGLWFSGDSANPTWLVNVGDFGAGRYSMAQSNSNGGVIGSAVTERLYVANGATSWTAVSDETLKNITGELVGALDHVAAARTVRGTYTYDETPHSFLIAQDWEKYLPEAISVDNNGKLGLSYTETIPVAFAAIKELAVFKDDHESRLAALEAKLGA